MNNSILVAYRLAARRRAVTQQAIANARAHGLEPHPHVLALCKQYAKGHLSWPELLAKLRSRNAALALRLEALLATGGA